MQTSPLLEALMDALRCLPGVGPKSAQRMAFQLLQRDRSGGMRLAQALTRMYAGRKTADELKAFLADKSDAEKTALRKNPRVAQIIEELRAEQGKTANIDTDELLSELE